MVQRWDRDADTVRAQREAVEQVAGLPIVSGELRDRLEQVSREHERVAPSVNKVRRRIGGWYRQELRSLVGPIPPPVNDLGATLDLVGKAGRSLPANADATDR